MISSPTTVSPGLRFLLSSACLVIVVAGLKAAATILVPLALALFVAVVSLPLLSFVRERGVPTSLAVLIVVLFDAGALFLFGWLVSLAALEVRDALPGYLERLTAIEGQVSAWFSSRGLEGVAPITGMWEPERLLELSKFLLIGATDVISGVFLVTLIFVFMMAEASSFPRKLRVVFGRDVADFSRSAKVVREIQHYLAIKTVVSVTMGVTMGIVTWAMGVDFPLLWGLLTFVLHYIPNVGAFVAAIPAIVVALVQLGPATSVVLALIFIGVDVTFGNVIEPLLVGHQLGISTLVVILSLVFWGWLWGAPGMFLSVPLTMALKIVLENSQEFRWVAYMMTSDRTTRLPVTPHIPEALPATDLPRKKWRVF